MILGFAHITKNVVGRFPNLPIPNAPEKWPLMERRATSHALIVRQQAGISEEIVEYNTGTVNRQGRLKIRMDGRVVIAAGDMDAEVRFFCDGLGFHNVVGLGLLHLGSHFRQWGITLAVDAEANAPLNPPLDIDGHAAIAFYSTDVEADRSRATAAGGYTPTDPFTVSLDREMKIIMLRSPEGTIVELIQVKP